MEAATEQESKGLLDEILPPRLEDAGLEDCALPPDSIHEAFLKAAFAVKSRATTFFHSDEEDEVEHGCVDDSFPNDKGKCSSSSSSDDDDDDVIVGEGSPNSISDAMEGCLKEKGCRKDVVIMGGDGEDANDGGLDDELKDLKIEDEGKKNCENQEKDAMEKEKPILVEGFM